MTEFRKRGLGWMPPEPSVMARLKFAKAPASEMLIGIEPADVADNSGLVRVVDQGDLGSCVANACGQIIRGEMVRNGAGDVEIPSRLWAYQLALNAQNTEGQDVGTNLATCMDCLAEFGYPPESRMPYDVASFGKRPSPTAWHDAVDQRAPGGLCYHQISETGDARVLAVRQALTAGHLVAFGTQVTEEFCSSQPPELVDVPKAGDTYAGGHAMVWCGYRAIIGERPRYRVANSWGPGFGSGGFFWMSEEYLRWRLTRDIWICSNPPRYSEAS
ncbi:MAG: hypothetical protein QG571_1879 [Pseudomonadota bacterium]|nr:hypothetical protein [Pseudomonadota bacterium]